MIDRLHGRRPPEPPPAQQDMNDDAYLEFIARAKSEEAIRHAPVDVARELHRIGDLLERLVVAAERKR